MRIYDIIAAKRDGKALTGEEIRFFIEGYTCGDIPDYQASALLMAICINGMDAGETAELTMAMAESGDQVDLSPIPGIKVDKHSTGGVGDKTTLIAGPIAASLGVKVAKMSGRGLGHTGGTIDKMESIPGMRTDLSREEFFQIVGRTGISVAGQSGNLVPADKKLYALRDVTATVESIPLIASSIMSKKLASGADRILLDVKTGSGAFMKTPEDAVLLAEEMVKIGAAAGRETLALVTNMDRPLGNAVGNALEIAEVCRTLKGGGPEDLTELSVELAANMLFLAQKGELQQCRAMAKGAVADGSAFLCLKEMIKAQGGHTAVLDDPGLLPKSAVAWEVRSRKEGFITAMDTHQVGVASMLLGAGRAKKEDPIDPGAGLVLEKKPGDAVAESEVLATLYAADEEQCKKAEQLLRDSISIGQEAPKTEPLIYQRINQQAG